MTSPSDAARPDPRAAAPDHEALIVGAGFGGMGMGIALDRLGLRDYLIVERADDLGGTWHLNRYPGLAVDIESVVYSYSFEPNPGWSRRYAPGRELHAYAHHVARKYGLQSRMRFEHDVEAVTWDEAAQRWTVRFAGRPPLTARLLILATGYLSRPQRPAIPGIETFAGPVLHTAAWDDTVELGGRRVGAIGTGATAVQLLPELAPRVAQLDVYQRTPIWCAPKPDARISKARQALYARVPAAQRALRALATARLERGTALAVLEQQRHRWASALVERACRAHIAHAITDPELRRKLTPAYPFGCKRPTFSNVYYPMFTRANVALITEGIARVEPDAIVTVDGARRPTDALVLATGFKLWERDTFHSIVGRGGVELRDRWEKERFDSYQGLTHPGFPNLIYLPSPYSYTGLSYFWTLEGQMAHVERLLRALRERGARSFEVTAEATAGFAARMRRRRRESIFEAGVCGAANSYYFDPHGEPSLIRPTSVREADREQASFPLEHYRFE